MPSVWLLAEFPGDAALLAPAARPGDRWLALTPTAVEELDARGIAAVPDGDVCDPEALNRIGRANFARAEVLVEACDRAILAQCPAVARWGFPPLRPHFTRVKFLLDAITIRLHILQVLTSGDPAEIRKARPPRRRPPTDGNLFYRADASLYEDLLAVLETEGHVRVHWLPRPEPPALRRPLPRPAAVLRRLRELALGFRGAGRRGSATARLLLLNTGYDLAQIGEACRAAGVEVFWLDLARLALHRFPGRWPCRVDWDGTAVGPPGDLQRELALVNLDEALADPCRADGVSLAPLVRRALAGYFQAAFPRALLIRDFVEACQRRYGFATMLSPAGPDRAETAAIFEACRRARIPVAVVQHGGYGFVDNPITNYYEFGFEGDFLSWGQGVEAHYGLTKRGPVRFVPVGSPTLDSLVVGRKRTAGRPRRVMYVITDFRGNSAYFPGGQPWLDTSYYCFQRQVLDLLERYRSAHDIWLKIPPGMDQNRLAQSPVRHWLRARGSRIRVEDRPLMDVIREPGLFLIDSPSTTVLQCLATRAQVIVLTGAPHFPVLPEARRLLEKRAICCDSPDGFLQAAEMALRRGFKPEDAVDDGFLAEYGTFRHDGESLTRIMSYLDAAVGSPSAPAPHGGRPA